MTKQDKLEKLIENERELAPLWKMDGVYPEITLEYMEKAIEQISIPKRRLIRIEICKKHWKELNIEVKETKDNQLIDGMLSLMLGTEVVIRPYLKNPRFYYED